MAELKVRVRADAKLTRELWLDKAVQALETQVFKSLGHKMPEKWEISCGFPYGHAKAIGQCFDPVHSPEGVTHMFVCPTQHVAMEVLAIIAHEMCHAIVGCECGHKGEFKKIARAIGLEGKLTATFVSDGSELYSKLTAIAEKLGDYPHKGMVKRAKSKRGPMGGWVRLMSESDETYKVVISPKVLEEHGAPVDPWGEPMVRVDGEPIGSGDEDDDDLEEGDDE
jgi:hypothetical protein